MDEKISKKAIENALARIGINTRTEKFLTEAHHLSSLIYSQKMTVAQALEAVQDTNLRKELYLFMYSVELSAVVIALQALHGITPEQSEDFQIFLRGIVGIE